MLPTGTFLYRQNELLASLPTIFFDYSTFVLDIHAQFFVAEYLRCQYTASLQKYFLGLQLYTSILQPMAKQYDGFSKQLKQYAVKPGVSYPPRYLYPLRTSGTTPPNILWNWVENLCSKGVGEFWMMPQKVEGWVWICPRSAENHKEGSWVTRCAFHGDESSKR